MDQTDKTNPYHSLYTGSIRGLSGKAAVVFEELERRLIYGQYKFSEVLPTVDLAKEFDVSRATLMMALNQLRFAGYVEIVPQVGSRVVAPSDRQVDDYFQMFGLVEHQFARQAAERRTPAILSEIERICAELSKSSVRLSAPGPDYIDLIDMYHIAIRRAADSILEVRRAAGYFRFAAFLLVNGRTIDFAQVLARSNRNRPLVTRHIREGNAQAAGDAMREYILAGIPARAD